VVDALLHVVPSVGKVKEKLLDEDVYARVANEISNLIKSLMMLDLKQP